MRISKNVFRITIIYILWIIGWLVIPAAVIPWFYSQYFLSKVVLFYIFAGGITLFTGLGLLWTNRERKSWVLCGRNVKISSILIFSLIFTFLLSFLLSSLKRVSFFGIYSYWGYSLVSFVGFWIVFGAFKALSGFSPLNKGLSKTDLLKNLASFTIFRRVVIVLTALMVFFSLYEHYILGNKGGYKDLVVSRLTLFYENPLYLAMFVVIILAIWIWWLLGSIDLKELIINALGTAVTALILVWSYTLGGILTFLIILLLVLLVKVVITWQIKDSWLILGRSVLVLAIIIFGLAFWQRKGLKHRISGLDELGQSQILSEISASVGKEIKDISEFYTDTQEISSVEIRLLEMRWAWDLIKSSPKTLIFGVGPELEYYFLPKYRPESMNYFPTDTYTRPFYVRNIYLHLWASSGLIFLLFFIAWNLYIAFIYGRFTVSSVKFLRSQALKEAKAKKISKTMMEQVQNVYTQIFMAGTFFFPWLAFLIYALFYTPDISIMVIYMALSGVLVALLTNQEATIKNKKEIKLKKTKILRAVIALVTILVGIGYFTTAFLLGRTDYYVESMLGEYSASKRVKLAQKAARLDLSSDIGLRALVNNSWQLLEQIIRDCNTGYTEGCDMDLFAATWETLTQALKDLEDSSLNSYDRDNLRILAEGYYKIYQLTKPSLGVLDDPDRDAYLEKAIGYGKRAIELDPTMPVAYDEVGLMLLAKEDFEAARTMFLKAIEVKSDYWFSYLHMGELLRQEGKPKQAIEYYKKALGKLPNAEQEINEAEREIKEMRSSTGSD